MRCELKYSQLARFLRRDRDRERCGDLPVRRCDRGVALREAPLCSAGACAGEERVRAVHRYQPYLWRRVAEERAVLYARPDRTRLGGADVVRAVREQAAGGRERVRAVPGAEIVQGL